MKTRSKLSKTVMCLFLAVTFVFTTSMAAKFSDVSSTDSYYKAVEVLSEVGIITGYSDKSFKPEGLTKRSEFCALLARAKNEGETVTSDVDIPFPDVSDDHWAKGVIAYCYNKGYINGNTSGYFSPEREITYEEAIKIIVCASGLDSSTNRHSDPWYQGYLSTASKNDILKNVKVTVGDPAPRHAIAQMIYNARALGYLKGSEPAENADDPDRKTLIVIDAGHNYSGGNTGASGFGLREQDITFFIADLVREKLEESGVEIIMTRESVYTNIGTTNSESLFERVRIANDNHADYFISIHCNAGGGIGTETYCLTRGGKAEKLSKAIQEAVIDETDLIDRGDKTANFFVLRNTLMPAILIETAFIDREEDAAVLESPQGREAIATGIAKGVCHFLKIDYLGIPAEEEPDVEEEEMTEEEE